MKMLRRLFLASFLLLSVAATAQAVEVPLGDFFKDPEFTSVSLSPSGEYITVSVPQGDRTVLAAFRVADMSLVGKWDYGEKKHIDSVMWVNDERFFMFVSRKVGRYDFNVGTPDVYASNIDGTRRADIPNGGTYSVVSLTREDPKTILVARASGFGSTVLYKMNVYDGEVRTVVSAPVYSGRYVVGSDGEPRYIVGKQEDQSDVTLRRDGDSWATIHTSNIKGTERTPVALDGDGKYVIFEYSDSGEVARVVRVDAETNKSEVLVAGAKAEPRNYLYSSDRKHLLAVTYSDGIPSVRFVNRDHPESKVYAGLINAFPDHAVGFSGISQDGRFILFGAYSDIDPGSYYLFDRQSGQAKFLLSAREWIKPEQMSPSQPIVVKARDGTELHGYLTVPRFSDGKDLPLVLNPHGGPHQGARDFWGFDPQVQFLANRGYAVLQINFRGSGGYGSEFTRMGYGKWGTTMIDDMTDAVDWVVKQGIADGDRVCTYGISYGGYAALQSVAREPTKYRCAIGYAGVYSLPLLFKDGDIPQSDWGQNYLNMVLPKSVAEQQAQSPALQAGRIVVPVMLLHGKKDVRATISHYDLMKDKLAEAGRPVEVTVVEDKEGHGFYDFQNQVDAFTAIEKFLDKYIGSPKPAAGAP